MRGDFLEIQAKIEMFTRSILVDGKEFLPRLTQQLVDNVGFVSHTAGFA
jgi:hypothetical protein